MAVNKFSHCQQARNNFEKCYDNFKFCRHVPDEQHLLSVQQPLGDVIYNGRKHVQAVFVTSYLSLYVVFNSSRRKFTCRILSLFRQVVKCNYVYVTFTFSVEAKGLFPSSSAW